MDFPPQSFMQSDFACVLCFPVGDDHDVQQVDACHREAVISGMVSGRSMAPR